MSSTENRPDSPYADGTVLTQALGTHAKVKILAVLLSESDRSLNVTDIAEQAGIERSTFYDHVEDLENLGLIVRTSEGGNTTPYRLNRESDAARALAELEWELIDAAPTPE